MYSLKEADANNRKMGSLPAHYSNETQLIEASWNRPLFAPLTTQIFAVIELSGDVPRTGSITLDR
jgi:hypothetical protein